MVAPVENLITESLLSFGTFTPSYSFSATNKNFKEYLDIETGLVYYISRYYTSELGR